MPAIKIQVGVGLAANPAAAFVPAVSAAKAATTKINAEFDNVGKKAQSVYRTNAREAERSAQQIARAHERALANVAKIRDRYFAQEQRQQEQLERKAVAQYRRYTELENQRAREATKAGQEMAANAGRYAMSGLRTAGRFAMEIARGAGVNLDIGSLVGKSVSMEKRAVDLANASIGTGVAGNEKRVSSQTLVGEARGIGQQMGFDPEAVLEGLQKYVAKTGDLASGRASLPGLAKLASATGSDLSDVVDAAGDVANALGDIPNKGKAVESVMRAIAGQGKVGAVEMKDLAVQMAKLGAAAGAFEGDKAKAVESMGILAQLARATGGAASASQATTSVARFVSTLQTPARLKEFLKPGTGIKKEDIYGPGGGLRDPFEIIKRTIAATGADPLKLHAMFASTVGNKPVDALAKVYRDAGGGQKGMAAIDAEVKRLGAAAMTDAAINEAHAERMKTSAAKIEQFNAKMVEVGGTIAEAALPALEQFAPRLISAGEGLSKFVGWATQNPGQAVGAIVAASVAGSIAKAAIGEAAGQALGKAISALPKNSFGFATAAITIAAASIAIQKYNEQTAAAKADVNQTFDATNALLKKFGEERKHGAVSKETVDALMQHGAEIQGLRKAGELYENPEEGTFGGIKHGLTKAVSTLTGDSEELAKREGTGAQAKQLDEGLRIQAQAISDLANAIKSGRIKVDVSVNENKGDPKVDKSNQTGPG